MRSQNSRPTLGLFEIALERPASIRRQLPESSDGWLVDTYYVGSENENLRYLFAARSIASLGKLSPIVLYGERFLGKTTLAITLAVQWSRLTNERPICFTGGDELCRDFQTAAEIDDLASFRRRLRGCKMLVIDGLEPIDGRYGIQEELCATLDQLADANRPVIITTACLPGNFKRLTTGLASRLTAGLSVPLVKPGKLAQHALIDALIAKIDPSLAANDLHAIADDLADTLPSPRELDSLVRFAHQNRQPDGRVDRARLVSLMRQSLISDAPNIPAIAKLVGRKLHVKLSDIRGSSRQSHIVRARGLAILLARRLTASSLQQIGEFFGGRDHTTILHACRKIAALLNNDSELANAYREIEAELLG